MTPVARVSSLIVVLAASLTTPDASQIEQVFIQAPGQTRDAPPPQPQERRIPVGTATISGSVVSADLGRPIRGARVMLNGQVTGAGRAAGPPGGGRSGAPAVFSGIEPAGMRGGAQMNMLSNLSRAIVTDENGNFSFARLPAGQFQL